MSRSAYTWTYVCTQYTGLSSCWHPWHGGPHGLWSSFKLLELRPLYILRHTEQKVLLLRKILINGAEQILVIRYRTWLDKHTYQKPDYMWPAPSCLHPSIFLCLFLPKALLPLPFPTFFFSPKHPKKYKVSLTHAQDALLLHPVSAQCWTMSFSFR